METTIIGLYRNYRVYIGVLLKYVSVEIHKPST